MRTELRHGKFRGFKRINSDYKTCEWQMLCWLWQRIGFIDFGSFVLFLKLAKNKFIFTRTMTTETQIVLKISTEEEEKTVVACAFFNGIYIVAVFLALYALCVKSKIGNSNITRRKARQQKNLRWTMDIGMTNYKIGTHWTVWNSFE